MIVRSTKQFIIDSRDGNLGVIALRITDWIREAKQNRFRATVEDMLVRDVLNPEPGAPLKSYEVLSRREVYRTNEEVNLLFQFIGVPIEIGDNFNEKIDFLIAQGLLIDTQQKPIYGSVSGDWELIDETLETQPLPAE